MVDRVPTPVGEATVTADVGGLRAVGEGWFVISLADAAALENERMGVLCSPEPSDAKFAEFGFNVRVLKPGQFNGRYHRENAQEAFLVLAGECVLIVEGQERRLRSGDFFHSPPLTGHVFVGSGDGPCTIVMVGGRTQQWCEGEGFPVDAAARQYDASVETPTASPEAAYADIPSDQASRLPWPPLAWRPAL